LGAEGYFIISVASAGVQRFLHIYNWKIKIERIYSGTSVDDHAAMTTKFPQSRMVSSLISINWPSLTRPRRYPDSDHWLRESQTANSPL
jgi:hypothetical protein